MLHAYSKVRLLRTDLANPPEAPQADEDGAQTVSIQRELRQRPSLEDGQETEDACALVEKIKEGKDGTSHLEVEEEEEGREDAVAVEGGTDGHPGQHCTPDEDGRPRARRGVRR